MTDLKLDRPGQALRPRHRAGWAVARACGAGEFFCLLGPSAAGKTTTLRAISGLEALEAGRVEFAGRDVTTAPVQGRGIAMIFQTFALYPHLTIRQNLAYPLREAGVEDGEIRRRVGEIAELLRIGHTLDRKPATASGGEQQRIAIGRALIRRPKLLLLDEPLTNLDAKLRHDTRAEFKRLHREFGMTMLYATPDELEALSMGQRIGVCAPAAWSRSARRTSCSSGRATGSWPSMWARRGSISIPATSVGDGAEVRLPFAEVAGGPWGDALRRFPVGTQLLFGLRPHDLRPAEGEAHGPRFPAQVHLTEPLGDVTVLDLEAQGQVLAHGAAGRAGAGLPA